MKYQYLTDDDVQHFLARGYITIKNAFTREQAAPYTDLLWTRLGWDADDKSTWDQPRVHMPSQNRLDVPIFAPRAYGAACELLGGEERIKTPMQWGDSFIVNVGTDDDAQTWEPPSADVGGWHKDGDWFQHFLDSPEQGLLVIVLWSDVLPTGGATFMATDSVPVVARFMARHPEGVDPFGFDFRTMICKCHDFAEATGELGDIVLMHPFMLHTSSKNALRAVRLITNPAVSLKEPMRFDRANPDDFSLVERAVLNGLGVENMGFQITGERRRIVPERVRLQEAMKEQEAARLAALQTG